MDILVDYAYRGDEMKGLLDIEALATFVMTREGKPDTSEVSISFVADEEIHVLNREWRGIDRPTDVLSFECDNLDDGFGVPDGEVYELGDIVIAPDVAEAQAPSYGLSFADEMSLLITHGLLHLCGYDHMEEGEALAM